MRESEDNTVLCKEKGLHILHFDIAMGMHKHEQA